MASQIQKIVQMTKLDVLDSNQSLAFIEEKTKLKPSVIALALIVFLLIVIVISEASAFVVAVACFIVPGYFSFLSLQTLEKDDDKKYLTYWIVFSITQIISPLFSWIFTPTFYTIIRVILSIAMLHPQLNLSVKIYNSAIAPWLEKHQQSIDNKINRLKEKGKQKFGQALQEGAKKLE